MTSDDRSTEDIITELMGEEIRRLCAELATERRQKDEILERHHREILDKQDLRTENAMLKAEVARLRNTRPVDSREVKVVAFEAGLVMPKIHEVYAEPSDYFGSIP